MVAKRKRRKTPNNTTEDIGRPSRWRLQHGGFTEGVREADPETGTPVVHRYAIDTLGGMLNNGTITREMHDAGEIFRRQFRIAALDTLRAMPLIRIPGGRSVDTTTEQQFQARETVAAAIDALGGPASPLRLVCSRPRSSITEWARAGGRRRSAPAGRAVSTPGCCALSLRNAP